jgi:hypothetical protein
MTVAHDAQGWIPSMRAEDTHEDIFVVGQVGHRLDVFYMGMYDQVQAGMYWYVLVCTDIYLLVKVIYRYVPVHIITC